MLRARGLPSTSGLAMPPYFCTSDDDSEYPILPIYYIKINLQYVNIINPRVYISIIFRFMFAYTIYTFIGRVRRVYIKRGLVLFAVVKRSHFFLTFQLDLLTIDF